jgi:hypothetical protein
MRWFLLSLLLIFGLAHSQETPAAAQSSANKKGAKLAVDQRGTEAQPFVIRVLPAEPKASVAHESKSAVHFDEARTANATENLVWVTAVLAFFTFLLWVATYLLVRESKATAKKQLRAYLSGTNGKLVFLPGHTFRTEVELRNSGPTPARGVRWAITGLIVPANQPPNFTDPEFSPGKHSIAPNTHWTAGYEFIDPKPTEADIQAVLKDEKWVYVWGHAEYTDIFRQPQTLKFRYRNAIKSVRFAPDGTQQIEHWWLYPEGEGNEAT